MRKLIRIVRSAYTPEFVPDGNHNIRRHLPMAILPKELSADRSNFTKEGEFFLVAEEELDLVVRAFVECNPGCSVEVYALEQSAQCPAAPMVVKKVSADGILPS